MAFKYVIFLCVHAYLAQSVFSQYLGPAFAGRAGLASPVQAIAPGAYGTCGAGVASSGGRFSVTSASPIAPTGVSVVSENTIEGALSAGGNLPLLGTVVLEGTFPSAGTGAVSYGCGSGAIGIFSEGPFATGILGPGRAAPAPTGPGYGPGIGYNGFGFGLVAPCGVPY